MSEQEAFWKGDFGDEYHARNAGRVRANFIFFERALSLIGEPRRVMELGCGTGDNLRALRMLYPYAKLSGVEINRVAADACPKDAAVYCRPVGDFTNPQDVTYDLVLTKGFLIHVPPEALPAVYAKMAELSARRVLIAEYYSPQPAAVAYRGHADRLWKRDFAGEFMAAHPKFRLAEYGFVSRYDQQAPQDDLNWFLLEKPA